MHHHHPQVDRWRHCGPGWTYALVLLVAAATLLSAGSGSALGQCQYEVTAIIEGPPGCPFSGNGLVQPRDMNDNGEVVGYWFCQGSSVEFAFRWDADSGLETLDIPVQNVTQARALGINNHGDICGTYVVGGDEFGTIGFVLTAEGEFITIPVPEGGTHIEAHAINDSGQVCGWWGDLVKGDPTIGAALIWEDGILETIYAPEEYVNIRAFDINEHGHLTGWIGAGPFASRRAFIWESGKPNVLPPMPEGLTSEGRALGDDGQMVGGGLLPGRNEEDTITRAARWDNQWAILSPLPEFLRSGVCNMSENGIAVGRSWGTEQQMNLQRASIWHDNEVFDLTALLLDGGELILHNAVTINSSGTILASSGGTRGAVLTPIDQPVADISGDCDVGVSDLLKLLENWSATDSFADVDNNGVVGVSDLLMLLADWNR